MSDKTLAETIAEDSAFTVEDLARASASILSGKLFAKGATVESVSQDQAVVIYWSNLVAELRKRFDAQINPVRANGAPNYLKGVKPFVAPGRGRKPGADKVRKLTPAEQLAQSFGAK